MSHSLKSALREHIGREDEVLYVVQPDSALLRYLYQLWSGEDSVPEFRVIADDDSIKNLLGYFKQATRIAAPVVQGDGNIRTLSGYDRTKLVASPASPSFWTRIQYGTVATIDSTDSTNAGVIESLSED